MINSAAQTIVSRDRRMTYFADEDEQERRHRDDDQGEHRNLVGAPL